MLPKGFKNCQKSNKSPNLVILILTHKGSGVNLPNSASLVKICSGDLSLSDASASRRQQCHVSYLFGRTEISREQTLFCSLANPSFLSSHRHHHQLFRAPNFNSQTVVCCNFFQIPCLCLWPVLNPPPPQTLLFSAYFNRLAF